MRSRRRSKGEVGRHCAAAVCAACALNRGPLPHRDRATLKPQRTRRQGGGLPQEPTFGARPRALAPDRARADSNLALSRVCIRRVAGLALIAVGHAHIGAIILNAVMACLAVAVAISVLGAFVNPEGTGDQQRRRQCPDGRSAGVEEEKTL